MKLAALVSGGKDSLYATYLARKEGHTIEHIITVMPDSPESYMYHYPNTDLTGMMADSMNIPAVRARAHAREEHELGPLRKALSELNIDGIVSGAIASSYQKKRLDGMAEELGIESFAPLWGYDQKALLNDIFESGFEVIIVSVAAEGLEESIIGANLKAAYPKLVEAERKYGINIAGEGGEYETLVLDCPLFSRRILPVKYEKEWDGVRGTMRILEAVLTEKN